MQACTYFSIEPAMYSDFCVYLMLAADIIASYYRRRAVIVSPRRHRLTVGARRRHITTGARRRMSI